MIEVVGEVTDEVLEALGRLLPQLSERAVPPDRSSLGTVIASPGVRLLVARVGRRIVGTLTLASYPTTTGLRAVIDDVVVDGEARGHGVGAALVREAVRLAGEAGAAYVDLTSRPAREAANRLYRALGFELRETNSYRLATR